MATNPKTTLENLAALSVCSALFLWGGAIANPALGTTISMGSGIALTQYCRKRKVAIRPLLGEALEATTPLLTTTAQTLKAEADEAPAPIKWGYQFLSKLAGQRTESDFDWFHNMQFGLGESHLLPYGNWLICGEQREGKTYAAKYMLSRYLDQHPGCIVLWADLEASSHPEGYHLGIPTASTPDDIIQLFRQIKAYLDTAKGAGSDRGLVVLWDECKATLNQLNPKQVEFVNSVLQDVHSRGAKRKVVILSIFHSLAGGVLKWQGIVDFATKANLLMLPYFAADDANFGNLQFSPSLAAARQSLALEQLPPLASPDPKPCLLYRNKQWAMRWIPTIPEIKTQVMDSPDPDGDPYPDIREFITGVEFPDEPLNMSGLLKYCDCFSSKHRAKDGKFYPQWQALLDAHNSQFDNPFGQLDNTDQTP